MNKLQKRALRKKRHRHQQYMKYEAPLDRFERALENLNGSSKKVGCPSVSPITSESCCLENLHRGECLSLLGTHWPTNAASMEGL